jgi:competence protein ComEA
VPVPTPAERQALLFVAAVAALGVGFRGFRALRADRAAPSAQASLATQLRQVDSAITSGGVARARRQSTPPSERSPGPSESSSEPRPKRASVRPPEDTRSASRPRVGPEEARGQPADDLRPSEPVDLDLAGLEDLDRLPGIGPALAARIVADREAKGPFGSLEQLQRVKGVGPALAAKLQPYVTFSLSPRLDLTEMPSAGRGRSP